MDSIMSLLNTPAVKIFFILLIIVFVMVVLIRVLKRNSFSSGKKTNNTVKRSGLSFLRKGSEDGIVFGIGNMGKRVCSQTLDEGHVAGFGGTGTGKTAALAIPTLRSWRGNFLAIDISGDIQKNVPVDNAVIYDPLDPKGIPFNVFAAIDTLSSTPEKNEALAQMALLMMPLAHKSSEAEKFFTVNGRAILEASLIAFYHAGYDFVQICELIMGCNYQQLFDLITESQDESAARLIARFEGANEKNTAGCKQAVDEKINLFAKNDMIKGSIRRNRDGEEFFAPITLEDKSVFVVIPDTKLKLYAPLLGLITAMTLEFLAQRENAKLPKLLLFLDEFASLGHLDILEALRKLRKKNVRIFILTQSVPDLDLEYGTEERKAMINNFDYRVVLKAKDPEEQKYFAEMAGYKREKRFSYSTGTNNTSKTESEERVYEIEPSEFARLGDYLILYHASGFMKLKKNFYFKYY